MNEGCQYRAVRQIVGRVLTRDMASKSHKLMRGRSLRKHSFSFCELFFGCLEFLLEDAQFLLQCCNAEC